MMDAWSRFVGCYAVERKTKSLVKKAMERFMRDFTSHGHLPKMILMDQGSDLVAAKDVIEAYRTKPGKLVFYSKVGKPVQLVANPEAHGRLPNLRAHGRREQYPGRHLDVHQQPEEAGPGEFDPNPIAQA